MIHGTNQSLWTATINGIWKISSQRARQVWTSLNQNLKIWAKCAFGFSWIISILYFKSRRKLEQKNCQKDLHLTLDPISLFPFEKLVFDPITPCPISLYLIPQSLNHYHSLPVITFPPTVQKKSQSKSMSNYKGHEKHVINNAWTMQKKISFA